VNQVEKNDSFMKASLEEEKELNGAVEIVKETNAEAEIEISIDF
jgi:hypothetical protein